MNEIECTREIAKIERTFLGFEDHGILTGFLHVTYGGAAQGIGGYSIVSVAGAYIERTLRACGVDSWEALKGRTIYVLTAGPPKGSFNRVLGIAPLPTEHGEPFLFAEVFKPDGES